MSGNIGYECECGEWHAAGMWAAAHWNEELSHECKNCGRKNLIRRGKVIGKKEDD